MSFFFSLMWFTAIRRNRPNTFETPSKVDPHKFRRSEEEFETEQCESIKFAYPV